MVGVAVQLYVLRSLDAPLPEVIDRVGAAGYDGVEFAYGVREARPEEVLDALARNDLAVASAHVPIDVLEDDPGEVAEFYDRLGADALVVPWLGPEHFEGRAAVDAAAARLDSLAVRVADGGCRLAYHNHDHEFATVDGAPAMERLLARTDDRLGLEVDAGWALAGGVASLMPAR